MASKNMMIIALFSASLSLQIFCVSSSRKWIQAGYWDCASESPISGIDSALFTHLICAFANINYSNYHLSIPEAVEPYFSSFTPTVKRKNPSIATLLSIWNGQAETFKPLAGKRQISSVFSSMINSSSNRKAFIEDSIKAARRYGFHGLDLCWFWPNSDSDMTNMGIFLDEWREAVNSESRSTNLSRLILSMALHYVPNFESATYPIESLVRNLDWGHVVAYDYHLPAEDNVTGAYSALYDPNSHVNTDYGINQWLSRGFPSEKLVLGLPFHGFAWKLVDPSDSKVGARASGAALTLDGSMSYSYIKSETRRFRTKIVYNATYAVNYCLIGSAWISFDDVESIRAKIAYAKAKNLVGYNAFQVGSDDNWVLSRAAHDDENRNDKKRRLLIILLPVSLIIVFLAILMFYVRRKMLRSKEMRPIGNSYSLRNANSANTANLKAFRFDQIKEATSNFSHENELGEGGFGIVYKGKLSRGPEIAVKRLSKTSNQGVEEFKNEVTLTARLQHVYLCSVLGYCTERDEKMLIYEYMPKRSLDLYIFDPVKRHELDWETRVNIIKGITQGLLYLQEYSNFTIIHRDLKASNILLDNNMNPKISDFGMAKLFRKDEIEANTDRIVGTYGYVPPEYVRKGTYSMKYDVYSFGVLLLQIISGKRNTRYYGPSESLHLLEYAHQTWSDEKGEEFFDPSLDDSSSPCKLVRCLQIALLCVQENPDYRPLMLEVFAMLRDETKAIATPRRPAFSEKVYRNEKSTSTSQHPSSIANLPNSDIFPR